MAVLLATASPALAADPGADAQGGRRPGGPAVIVEPTIVIGRMPRPDPDAPERVMAALRRCVADGQPVIVDCLRASHGSILIRRLEDCLRSETIPEDPTEVEACLRAARRP